MRPSPSNTIVSSISHGTVSRSECALNFVASMRSLRVAVACNAATRRQPGNKGEEYHSLSGNEAVPLILSQLTLK